MKGIFSCFWILLASLSLFAKNYIAAVPFIKGQELEESAEIIEGLIKTYNRTASFKLMDWANMESMLSRSLLERTIYLEDTAYCLAVARQLDVQYLVSIDFEKTDTGNSVTVKIFDFKAQIYIQNFSKSGVEPPYVLVSAMISLITPDIDEILSNDRVVSSLVEKEKNTALTQKPEIQSSAGSSVTLSRKERKKLKEMEKFKREQDKILAETEKKRAEAEKKYLLVTKQDGAIEEQVDEDAYEQKVPVHTTPLIEENPAATNATTLPVEISGNGQEKEPAQMPETIPVPTITIPDASAFKPDELKQNPALDFQPPAVAQTRPVLDPKEAAAMARAEKRRFKDMQKLKRAETSAMVKAEKKRSRYYQ